MNTKTVPISLSRNDYNYLNYVQQGLLYSGHPVSGVFDFSDILKACVLSSSSYIYGSWERIGKMIVEDFLKAVGVKDFDLPKTNKEFTLELKLELHKNIVKSYLYETDNKELESLRREFGGDQLGSEPLREPGMSNLILKLRGEEIFLFDELKDLLERFKGSTVSYSEMTRTLFRNTFIDVRREDSDRTMVRDTLLGSFYVYGVYGFTAVESVLIRSGILDGKNYPTMSKDGLEKLSRVYSDQTLFDIYIEELKKDLKSQGHEKRTKRKAPKKEKIDSEKVPIFQLMGKDRKLDEKYRSVVINSLGFHSVFLGYVLLHTEWFLGQHKIPLLLPYFISTNELDYTFTTVLLNLALDPFIFFFHRLFSVSKEYRDNPGR